MGTAAQILTTYVPCHLVARLAPLAGASGAVTLPAALVFADISGFTALTERLVREGPEGVERMGRILNRFFDGLVSLVEAGGGEVVTFAGDGLVAMWPADDGDLAAAATRATASSLAAQGLLEDFPAAPGTVLRMKVGLGVGAVTAARVGGEEQRWEAVLSGQPLVQVALAERAAGPGQVVASAEVWALLADRALGESAGNGFMRLTSLVKQPPPLPLPPLPMSAADLNAEDYVPRVVRGRVRDGQSEWLAELRQVSVMFVQLCDLQASDVPGMQAATVAIQRALHRYEGSLDKIIVDHRGASLLAAFGLPPLSHEDDPLRAVHAAIAIEGQLAELGVTCAIGIATGRVFCGPIGPARRRQYTMIGAAVNLAARLMQATWRGTTLCALTRAAVADRIECTALPPVPLKGYSEAITAFRAVERTPAKRGRRQVFGRQDELALLDATLDAFGQGQVAGPIVFEAEAGLGKTALVDELIARAEVRGVEVLTATGDAIESATPYHAWRPVFARLMHIDEAPDAEARRHLAVAAIADLIGCEGLAPLLEAVLPLDIDETPQTEQLTGQLRADRTIELLLALLERVAATGPLLLIFEDLHWFDSASTRLGLRARDRLGHTLVVATTRPMQDERSQAVRHLCAAPTGAHRLLAPLQRDACCQLIADRLGVETVSGEVAELICARSERNPLFAESLALALRDSGALRIEAGRCVLDPSAGRIAAATLPDSLQGVIGSRIDRLSVVEQLTLKAASAVGRSFLVPLLHDIHPLPEARPALLATLADLVRQDLVASDPRDLASTMAFKNVITQEVTYNLMLFEQRRDLHRAVAAWYEHRFAGELAPYYPLLAHHHGQAGDEAAELTMLQLGAQEALKAGAWREAARLLHQCLATRLGTAHIVLAGELEPPVLREARWLRQLSDAYDGLGDVEGSGSHAQRALARLDFAPAKRGTMLVLHTLTQALQQAGRSLWPGLWPVKRGVEREAALEAARAWQRLGQFHFFSNQAPEMVAAVLFGANAAARAGPSADLATAQMALALLFGMIPVHGLARRFGAHALREAERNGGWATLAWVRMLRGLYRVGTGEWHACRADLDAAQALCDSIEDRKTWGDAQALRTWTHHYRGEGEAVSACAQALLERAKRDGNHQFEAWAERFIAARLAGDGEHAAAATRYEQTLVLLRAGRDRAEHLVACGSAAASFWACGRLDEAESLAFESLELGAAMDRPTSHILTEGFAAMTDVFCAIWQREPDGPRRKAAIDGARRGLRALNQCRRIFPVAVPAWLRLTARIRSLEGRHWRSRRAWNHALAAARRLGMRLEEQRLLTEQPSGNRSER